VQEARRKLALAAHPSVAGWLERWARCELSEDTRDSAGDVYSLRAADATNANIGFTLDNVDAQGVLIATGVPSGETQLASSPTPTQTQPQPPERHFSHTSQQILRGYLFYPLAGDEQGLVGWEKVAVRGSASPGHLRVGRCEYLPYAVLCISRRSHTIEHLFGVHTDPMPHKSAKCSHLSTKMKVLNDD
jgi:hypothetical protein